MDLQEYRQSRYNLGLGPQFKFNGVVNSNKSLCLSRMVWLNDKIDLGHPSPIHPAAA